MEWYGAGTLRSIGKATLPRNTWVSAPGSQTCPPSWTLQSSCNSVHTPDPSCGRSTQDGTPHTVGPLIQVPQAHTLAFEKAPEALSMQITDFIEVVNQPLFFFPRLLKCHWVSIADKKKWWAKKIIFQLEQTCYLYTWSHGSAVVKMIPAAATGMSPTKGLSLIIQSQTVLILGLLAMTI